MPINPFPRHPTARPRFARENTPGTGLAKPGADGGPTIGDALKASLDPDLDGVDPDEDDRLNRGGSAFRYDGSRRILPGPNGLGGPTSRKMLLPHEQQFAGRYGVGNHVYWSRFDEALRDNWLNGLAMRRSSFIEELINHRTMPVVSLPWHVEVDDAKDPDQEAISQRLTKLIEAIPRFQMMRYYLSKSLWQGKYGSQVTWNRVMVDGKPGVTITDHEPVDGDAIVYKYDKTPGILVRSDWTLPAEIDRRNIQNPDKSWFQQADRARALFLYDQFWRDHFIIQNFIPSSADFLFEGDKAASIFGVGYRSLLYWDFQLREELRSWRNDALQRIGVNGMLYGFYQSGNPKSQEQVLNALALIIRDNVTAFPVEKDAEPQEIRHIEPSQVGYDVIDKCVADLEDSMRRCVLGQSLTSEAQGGGGLGNEAAAELHRSTFEYITRFDAANQQETLTEQLLKPMIRMNEFQYRGKTISGELPFRARLIYSIDKANVSERSTVIFGAFDRGLELSKEAVYDDLALKAPDDENDILKRPEQAPGMGGMPGAGGPPPPPGMSPDGGPLGPGKPPSVAPHVHGKHHVRHKIGVSRRISGGFQLHKKPVEGPGSASNPIETTAQPQPVASPARRTA